MGQVQRVVIPYGPRPQLVPFHNRTQRWACLVAHRRFGKTVGTINDLIRGAMVCDKTDPRFAYIAPLLGQAKDVAWEYLKRFALVIPGAQAHETELRIDLPNGGRIRLYGADNPDRLRGLYLDGVVLDEYADMRPRLWSEVVRPALADRKGWAVFIGTPKGRNEFWQIYDQATRDPEWYSSLMRASETGILSADELEAARKSMSEDQFAQEFECSFQAAVMGAYYGRLLEESEKSGRIGRIPYDPMLEVSTAWDLGVGDSTSIWFVQQLGREVRVIDYYEASGVGLDHYAKVLREKPYAYREHILPHDAEVRELGTGRSRIETLASLGVRGRTLPKQSVEDGINAARVLLPSCYFDGEKCKHGLEALRQYRRAYDDKRRDFLPTPLHDWTSHAADAFRYLAMGLKPAEPRGPRVIMPAGAGYSM